VFGTYKKPLVEISPEDGGDNTAENEVNAGWWHADSTYWGIRINDPVQLDDLDFDKDSVELD